MGVTPGPGDEPGRGVHCVQRHHCVTQRPTTNTYQGMVTNRAERTVLSEVLPWYVLYLNLFHLSDSSLLPLRAGMEGFTPRSNVYRVHVLPCPFVGREDALYSVISLLQQQRPHHEQVDVGRLTNRPFGLRQQDEKTDSPLREATKRVIVTPTKSVHSTPAVHPPRITC